MLEVNPRYTASVEIIERATGIAALSLHADACNEMPIENPQSAIELRPIQGKAIVYAKCDLVISDEFAAMALAEAARRPWPQLADISAAGTLVEAGRPVLTVFAEGASDQEVQNQLHERVATIEDTLYVG
jgi:predicted ATP-grasp superfamily ATP-dependent carboligase